jgi:hypothetical protein
MHMPLVGAQVISRPVAHGHRAVTFVPYFSVENLATIAQTKYAYYPKKFSVV